MLFDNVGFNAMQSGLDALWMKQKVISDNIANVETPGYKAKEVSFEDLIEQETDKLGRRTDVHHFQANVIQDETTSIRPDGNNVNMEKESIELWRAYAQYNALSQKISGQFKNMRYVIGNAFK